MKMNPIKLLLAQSRVDLIWKYLYAKHPEDKFVLSSYLDILRVWTNFVEYDWENPNDESKIMKYGIHDFVDSFDKMIHQFNNGQIVGEVCVPCSCSNFYLLNGAHRLALFAALGMNEISVDVGQVYPRQNWNYKFILERGLPQWILDYSAIEYVKLNDKVKVVVIPPTSSDDVDKSVEFNLNLVGFVYYCKRLNMSNGVTRVYVYSDYIDKNEDISILLQAKCGSNYYLSTSHEDAIRLAEAYFSDNTIMFMINRNTTTDNKFDETLNSFKQELIDNNIDISDVALIGKSMLCLYGKSKPSRKIEFISRTPIKVKLKYGVELETVGDYVIGKKQMIENPKNYFYYNGMKVVCIENMN